MQRIHDGLYNGKTDAAAAVLPGSGFVYLIEFVPNPINVLLRDLPSGIEDGYPYLGRCV